MFDKDLFVNEMQKITNNIENYYDADDAWEMYDHANFAIQGAYYHGLIDQATMQEAISKYVDAAVIAEQKEKDEQWLYGYTYRPL